MSERKMSIMSSVRSDTNMKEAHLNAHIVSLRDALPRTKSLMPQTQTTFSVSHVGHQQHYSNLVGSMTCMMNSL